MLKHPSVVNKVLGIIIVSIILVAGLSNFINSNYLVEKYENLLHESNRKQLEVAKQLFEKDLLAYKSNVELLAKQEANRFATNPDFKNDMNGEEEYYTKLFTEYLLSEESLSDSVYIYFNPEIDGDVHDVWITKQNDTSAVREVEVPLSRYINNDNMDWFYKPMETGVGNWLNPYYNRYNQYVTSYVSPMFADGEYLGIIGMYYNLDEVKVMLDDSLSESGDMFWLYNQLDQVIYHPMFKEGTSMEITFDLISGDGKNTITRVKLNEKDYYTYNDNLSNDWQLIYAVPTAVVDDEVISSLQIILLVVIICFIVVLIPIYIFTSRYKVHLNHVIDVLNKMKNGDLQSRINVKTDDEIGIMARAINESSEGLLRNIEEKKRLAYYNGITGISNRNSLSEKLSGLLTQGRLSNLTLVYVDIDKFRNINELLGYQQGNVFIKHIAEILSIFEEANVKLYHTNVDEFVYLIRKPMRDDELRHFSKRLLSEFGKNYTHGYHSFYLTISVGIARYNKKIKDISDFYRIADIAIYEAKKLGRNNGVIYNESMYDRLIQFNLLEKDFEQALKNNNFVVHYQPQVDCASESTHSVEALVRWEHPEKGLLFPNYFIDYAEKSGLITKLGDVILENACRDIKRINDQGGNLKVAINISKRQIMENDFVSRTIDIIETVGIEPKFIELEVTESLIVVDSFTTINKLNQLKNYGVAISLDDFGTGYSSFNSLNEMPISILKIDKSLIDNILSSKEQLIMAESIIELSHKLKLTVIAEGVESLDQVKQLKTLNCDIIQGYYYSKPIDVQSLEKYLDKNH